MKTKFILRAKFSSDSERLHYTVIFPMRHDYCFN